MFINIESSVMSNMVSMEVCPESKILSYSCIFLETALALYNVDTVQGIASHI